MSALIKNVADLNSEFKRFYETILYDINSTESSTKSNKKKIKALSKYEAQELQNKIIDSKKEYSTNKSVVSKIKELANKILRSQI